MSNVTNINDAAYTYAMNNYYYYYLADEVTDKEWYFNKMVALAQNSYEEVGYFDPEKTYWDGLINAMKTKPGENMTAEEHYFRNNLNIEFEWDNFQKLQERLPQKYSWYEEKLSGFHQNNLSPAEGGVLNGGLDGVLNKKFVSACGHFEIVYSASGEIQTKYNNYEDMGTYNYYSSKTDKSNHNTYDVVPYNSKWMGGKGYGNVPQKERN